jgi:hypothetical protein
MMLLMTKTRWILFMALLWPAPSWAADQDPMACVKEIEKVCVQLEDNLESCLEERGTHLSADCRDQLQSAMALAQDPSGPAACIPDVKRLCPDLKPQAFARCLTEQMPHFSEACQAYLQKAHPE